MTAPGSVSVIVPGYNATEYIDAALASLVGQTVPPDEVVVIDDGSSDDTAQFADRWSNRLPLNLICLDQNVGLGAARRAAIDGSKGELIALLDSDDVWFPDHLEVLLRTLDESGLDMVTAANYRWWPNQVVEQVPSNVRTPIPPPDKQASEILRRNFLWIGSLFRRDDYDRAGGFRALRISEDWDLWLRMIRDGVRVATPPTVTALYRQRASSLSGLDGCLLADIDILEGLDDLSSDEQRIVDHTLRRLHARRNLLEGYELSRVGQTNAARRKWLKAVHLDRSLRWGEGQTGSQALRAAACIVAPNRFVSFRDRRIEARYLEEDLRL